MNFKIILSPRAIQDLREIVRYIAFDNPLRVEEFGRELIVKTHALSSFPELGRRVPEIGAPHVREIVFKSYCIVYRVRHEQKLVEVSRFWHGARGTPLI